MTKKKSNYIFKFFLICVFTTSLYSHSRTAFSRPGTFIRTPSSLVDKSNDRYFVGFSNEFINTKNNVTSNAIYFKGTSINGYEYGISYSKRAPLNSSTDSPANLSFHFIKEIYRQKDFIINVGIQDVLFESDEQNQISTFISLINKDIKLGTDFSMQTAIGFGTGKIKHDSYDYTAIQTNDLDIFVGFKINTPLFLNRGGLIFLTDYDGNGINIASQIAMTPKLILKFGITHFENMVKFNTYENQNNQTIYSNSPALSFGLEFAIEKNKELVEKSKNEFDYCFLSLDEYNSINTLTLNEECTEHTLRYLVADINDSFEMLNDSLLMLQQEIMTSYKLNNVLSTQNQILKDSIYVQHLNQLISYSEINQGMKHLSNSLKFYYSEDFHSALKEVEKSQKFLPNLAYSYARKGSIYYKLGDIKRATINWNIALQLDPEYIEVRQMLINMKKEQNNLNSTSN